MSAARRICLFTKLIQRTPAGSSFRLLAQTFYSHLIPLFFNHLLIDTTVPGLSSSKFTRVRERELLSLNINLPDI